ncbi:protocadherin-17 isoform X1 [Octopus sinensis]|uniref:Protocadherin-17 isoform X1 n=1 Tax=Octopus sinensis TaxID=2607531 RepID=A0A6P7T2G0_9MOLL|nr:protocadherin-17 isoform X1 [Octopus sinensis]
MQLNFGICLLYLHYCLCIDFTYYVKEGEEEGTYLGDIAVDMHLYDSNLLTDRSKVTFSQFQRSVTQNSQLFNVTKSGKIYTAQTLDSDTLCSYNQECFKTIKIAIQQAKAFIKILKVRVVIQDINDHQPKFKNEEINIQFSEDASIGVRRSIPNAIDRDVGLQNSQISYHLGNNIDNPFALSTSKSVDGISQLSIFLKEKLDREKQDKYVLEIVAKDGGLPPKESVLIVKVTVTDVNDNTPVFLRKVYNITTKNKASRMMPIITLTATDLDSGDNGKVSYHFSSKTASSTKSHFMLNERTGEIYLQQIFPLRSKLLNELYVRATDKGKPPLSSAVLVLVNIINQQNNYPSIDVNFVSPVSESSATISEDTAVGSFIAYVMVTDNDIGLNGEVTCELHHDKFQLLMLESKEYKVNLKDPVDREVQDHYDITISCEDQGSPSLETKRKFSIQVMDVNDVQPKFTKSTFKFLTYENKKANFPIGFINATDPDLGQGGQLTYSLLTNNKYNFPFQITNYGFISTRKPLDHEIKNIYKFQVFVKDNGKPSFNNTANVFIEVMDENDNAPYFSFPSVNPFSLDVHYYPNKKTNITVLKAFDRDSRTNAFLKYEILRGNDKHLFSVNPYTGVLSFSRPVYQDDVGSYNLEFIVKDSGTPVLSAMTTVSLTLTVSNKTSRIMPAVNKNLNEMVEVDFAIVIVLVAMIVSIAVVVSIATCIIRCNRARNAAQGGAVEVMNPSLNSRSERRQLINQTDSSVVIPKSPSEMRNRNIQLVGLRSQLYSEDVSQNDWKTSTLATKLPSTKQIYVQQVAVTAGGKGVQESTCMVPHKQSDRIATHLGSHHKWSDGQTGLYEEIAGML